MKNTSNKVVDFFKGIVDSFFLIFRVISYMLIIITYGILVLIRFLERKLKFLNKVEDAFYKFIVFLDHPKAGSISRVELIHLAVQNMKSKKNRTSVTVGGMTVGIATIVLLVSIAFGLQSLVINRVARLEEMRQTDVAVQPGSNLLLNDDVLKVFRGFANVDMVLPQIAVVGKVNFNNSSTDMAVYGVTKDYLVQSAIAPVVGKSFESNEMETTITVQKEVTEVDNTQIKDDNLTGDWVIVDGESDTTEKMKISKVIFPDAIKDKEAVVNRSFLKVLNINEAEAVGKKFSVSFIATSKSLLEGQSRIESTATEYTIVGVTPDDVTPLFYVPFIHLKSLGINNFSQVKVIANKDQNLATIRTQVEAQGFTTASVADTVAQIDSLFSTVRTVLAILGAVALFVASLGMFNTLTVSLLERTREIGLLKAMGMKSHEIRDLFLAESMIMGTLGGFLGIASGLAVGKIIELGLSIYASVNGAGTITIVDMPIIFGIFIVFLSFMVGVLTGFYPAKRATKISALNALRYE